MTDAFTHLITNETFSDLDDFQFKLSQSNITDVNDYLILSQPLITDTFIKTGNYFIDEGITDIFSIEKLIDSCGQVIAMTIDGDFICASDDTTWVMPKSLLLSDIETYSLSIDNFFKELLTDGLTSQIISSPYGE